MRLLSALLAATVFLLAPRISPACVCEIHPSSLQVPAPDATSVPLNARVLVGNGRLDSFQPNTPPELLGPDRANVEVTVGRLELEHGVIIYVLTPAARLQPGTTYRVQPGGTPYEYEEGWAFTTGDGIDEAPPPVPSVVQVQASYDSGSDCSDSSSVRFAVKGDGAAMLVDLDDRAHLAGLAGTVHDAILPGGPTSASWGACSATPGLEPGDHFTIRAAAVDQAGNVSAWSAPVETSLPSRPTGCATSPGAGLAGLLAIAVWVARRRRAGD